MKKIVFVFMLVVAVALFRAVSAGDKEKPAKGEKPVAMIKAAMKFLKAYDKKDVNKVMECLSKAQLAKLKDVKDLDWDKLVDTLKLKFEKKDWNVENFVKPGTNTFPKLIKIDLEKNTVKFSATTKKTTRKKSSGDIETGKEYLKLKHILSTSTGPTP